MTPLSIVLALAGLVAFGAGALALNHLMPKLKTRERRGEISTVVPDPHDSQWAGVRLFWLVWTLKTSEERPRFRRHVMLARWLPVIGCGLMAAAPFISQGEPPSASPAAFNGPPAVMIPVSG